MYKLENGLELTEQIKKAFKKGITRAYLICDGVEINADNYLMSVEYSDEKADPQDGKFIGKAICRSIDIKLNNRENVLNLENKEVEYHLGAKVGEEFVYINFGKFIVQKPENTEINEEITFTALDYMSKFDIKYVPNIPFPTTLLNIAEDICNQCGVQLGNTNFRNANKRIEANPFTNAEQCREVIKSIAKVSFSSAYIWQDNKLYFGFDVISDAVSEELTTDNYFETEKNNEIKPITVITLRSSEVPTSGKSIRNKNLIKQYGENELIVEEDYFAFTDTLRQSFLQEAESLFGLTYYPISIDLEGSIYLSFNDVIKITNLNNEVIKTYCLNNTHTYNGVLYNTVSTPALTKIEEKYIYKDEDKTKRTKTAIEIDKANAKITQVVEQVGKQNTKINKITQTVDELNSKISDIADITTSLETITGRLNFENINQSEPIHIEIHPIGIEGVSSLYPNSKLYPSTTLKTRLRVLKFTNTKTEETWEYKIPDNLYYYDENNYDSFVLDYDSQTVFINKKCKLNADGTIGLLEQEIITQYEYPRILLTDGDYTVEILKYKDTPYSAYLMARLMVANIYTTQFATKAELSSEINQTVKEIDLSVNEKLTGYPTTTEMNSAINIASNEINLKVEKKVDEEEFTGANIMLAINADTSDATIKADKVSLERKNNKHDIREY